MERTTIEQLIETIDSAKAKLEEIELTAYDLLVQFDNAEETKETEKSTKRKTPHNGRREWTKTEEDIVRAYINSTDADYTTGKKPTVTEFARFIGRNPKSVFTKRAQFCREAS